MHLGCLCALIVQFDQMNKNCVHKSTPNCFHRKWYNVVKGEALEPNGSGKTVLKGTKDITIATAVQEKGQYLTKQNCSCKHGTEL